MWSSSDAIVMPSLSVYVIVKASILLSLFIKPDRPGMHVSASACETAALPLL